MVKLRNFKYRWALVGLVVGILISGLNILSLNNGWFLISRVTNLIPRAILILIFGTRISPEMVKYGLWIGLLIYPLLFLVIGYLIDISNKEEKYG